MFTMFYCFLSIVIIYLALIERFCLGQLLLKQERAILTLDVEI